jgi:ribose transport system substrate-binding protein
MGFKCWAASWALVAVLVGATGCGNDGGEPAASATGAGASREYTIGIVGFSSANATSNQAIAGVEDVAKKRGSKTTVIDAQGAPDKAVAAIQTLVQKKVDLIVLTVFPPSSVTAGAMAAKAAGIPIMSVGGGTGNGVQASWDFGREQGRLIAEKLKQDSGGQGALLALGYKPGFPCQEREQALMSMLKSASYKLDRQEVPIPGQVQAATKFTQAWLASHPKGSGKATIWACFDEPAIGAITALKQSGRRDVAVYSVDGVPQALSAVRAGDLTATVWVDAYGAGRQMGEAVPEIVKRGVNAEPLERSAPSVVVDESNIDELLKTHPDALSAQ